MESEKSVKGHRKLLELAIIKKNFVVYIKPFVFYWGLLSLTLAFSIYFWC